MNDIISDLQDMRYLNWTRTRKSSGTAGSFLKAYDDSGKKKKILKDWILLSEQNIFQK